MKEQLLFSHFFSIILCFICIVCANLLLPEYCSLFSSNIESGFACDGIDWRNPNPCAICRDKGTALTASIIAGAGICFLFVPFVVYAIQSSRRQPIEQTKLFD
jgi:TRAP-type C4-dicarboxylate transport system permease small subunit